MSTYQKWFSADYSQGSINEKPVVLVRGLDYYRSDLGRDDLPWRIFATATDMDDARRIARLLNEDTNKRAAEAIRAQRGPTIEGDAP